MLSRRLLCAALAAFAMIPSVRAAEVDPEKYETFTERIRYEAQEKGGKSLRGALRLLEERGFLKKIVETWEEVRTAPDPVICPRPPRPAPGIDPRLEKLLDAHYAPQGYIYVEDCAQGARSCEAYAVLDVEQQVEAALVIEEPDEVYAVTVELGDLVMPGGDMTAFETLLVNVTAGTVKRID